MKHKTIKAAWAARNNLLDEGDKLRAEGNKLRTEGYNLLIEAVHVYRAAVTAKHGDKAIIDWETGEVEAVGATPQPVACVQDHETDPNEKDAARCGTEPFTDERWCARQAGIDAWADKRNGGE